ncbi:hypothetical protein ACS0TY_029190 [Phlomoides rotata]
MMDRAYSPYGEQWRRLRSIFVHDLMSTSKVKSYSSMRSEEIGLMVEKIRKYSASSTPVNLSDMLTELMYDLVSRAGFGKKHSQTEHGSFRTESILPVAYVSPMQAKNKSFNLCHVGDGHDRFCLEAIFAKKMKGKCLNLGEQVDYFQKTVKEKRCQNTITSPMSYPPIYQNRNDYISNYYKILFDTTRIYTPQYFATLLINNLSQQFQRLYELGARKVVISEIGPIGCMPIMTRLLKQYNVCVEEVNEFAIIFNKQLAPLLRNLTSTLRGSSFILGRIYGVTYDAIINPSKYGNFLLISLLFKMDSEPEILLGVWFKIFNGNSNANIFSI